MKISEKNIHVLRMKYFLGLVNLKEIHSWAEAEINNGNSDENITSLYLAKNSNEIIHFTNELAKLTEIDSDEYKRFFYDMFISELDSKDLVSIEQALLTFKNNSEELISFTDAENQSYSIIQNDLELRKEFNIGQLKIDDVERFLRNFIL